MASFYARCYGVRYVIDSHTGAFLGWKWRWSVGLHRWLSRFASLTIVHNVDQEEVVKGWGCRYCVLGFTPGYYPAGLKYPLDRQYNIAVISTFGKDEPLAEIFDAAKYLNDVCFYFTGNSQRIEQALLSRKPENCRLTGYLSYEQYVGLLRGVNAVMDLTSRDHTLLMGGFEAVSLGKPFITSDWPVLRNYFSMGTVHIPNTVAGVLDGIYRSQCEQQMLQQGILRLREQLQAEWEQKYAALRHLLLGDSG